jgi:uncharacterized protein YPO0396
MVQLSSGLELRESQIRLDGFRLLRLEVYNWGTFNQRIWTVTPSGGSALLTGANGSGKSTLVDALLTLLVPFHRRTYNLASGSEKQRERDERSYVLGAWGKQKELESNRSKAQYLRQNDTHSVLLAVFANDALGQVVTLAQILWLEEKVHKLYFVAPRALNIKEHFRLRGSPKDLRKLYRAQGIEVYDEFAKYSQHFRQLLSFRSEKALDLFNQIVSIKEIGSLNAFVREHMLEKMDAQARIKQLQDNFANLTSAHDAIQLADRQLAILKPLMQDAQKYREIQERILETNRCAELLSMAMAQSKLALLSQAITNTENELRIYESSRQGLQQTLDNLSRQIRDLEVAIRNDEKGQRIENLKRDIQRHEERKQERKNQTEKYDRLAKALDLPRYDDEETFHVTRRLTISLQAQINRRLVDLTAERDKHVQNVNKLVEACQGYEKELSSLKRRSSQIPGDDIEIRQQMVEKLNLDEADLPFVGELLRVRSSEQQWEPAIERLMHSFGRQMLVAEQHYQRVSRYVDSTDLRGRLVYHRIQGIRTPRTGERLEPDSLYHKLEVKPNNAFTQWLRAEIIDGFNYRCCESLEDFQRAGFRALTLNGQIKHGLARHEKDDRKPLGDRRNYVLGWDNREKLALIAKELADCKAELEQVSGLITQVEKQQDREREKQSALQLLLAFDSFQLIDWRAVARQLDDLCGQLQELEASSTHLATLRRQRDEAETLQKKKQGEHDQLVGKIANLKKDVESYQKQERICQGLLSDEALASGASILERIQKDLKDIQDREKLPVLSLETIDDIRDRLRQLYTNRVNTFQGQLRQQETGIVNVMRNFLQTKPALAQEMDASIEALDEYRRHYERIQHDDLPKYRNQFKALLNEKVVTDIGSFKAVLEQQEEDIRESIAHLNGSLRSIDYTDSTYIQLNCERTHDADVKEFRNLLKDCLPDVGQARTPEDNENSFQRIRVLLQRFEKEANWTNKVSNVRNWLDFSASELYRENGTQINYYSDSSGKSGGQKAKLAYTILASAIAYQYGLDQERGRERTFRFVVVDEAFSKSDERNARYAMELFRQLDLQVLVVTPLDKIHVAEPYISACHFVTNNEEENDSKVYNLTSDQYEEYKRKWRAQEGR